MEERKKSGGGVLGGESGTGKGVVEVGLRARVMVGAAMGSSRGVLGGEPSEHSRRAEGLSLRPPSHWPALTVCVFSSAATKDKRSPIDATIARAIPGPAERGFRSF